MEKSSGQECEDRHPIQILRSYGLYEQDPRAQRGSGRRAPLEVNQLRVHQQDQQVILIRPWTQYAFVDHSREVAFARISEIRLNAAAIEVGGNQPLVQDRALA